MIPETPKSGDRILNWANQVNKWMRANTLKNVIGGKLRSSPNGQTIEIGKSTLQKTKIPKHPFQATANGDDTVNIAPGAVLSWLTNNSGNLDNGPFYGDEQNFLGDDVTVTGSGTIYLVLTTGLTEVAYDSFGAIFTQVYRATAAPTVAFEPTFTGTNLYLPVADVSLTDSVASVTRQLLGHNPLLQLHFAYEDTP